jgi:hypothetical protein
MKKNKNLIVGGIITCLVIFIFLMIWFVFARVNVIEHDQLDVTLDPGFAIDAGCVVNDAVADCSMLPLLEKYNCDNLNLPMQLGGLVPQVPIFECTYFNDDPSTSEGLVREGCELTLDNKYLVKESGVFIELDSAEAFMTYYQPIDSVEEALSYTLALTGSYTEDEIVIPWNYRTYVDEIDTTYVKAVDGGYLVHLFDYGYCGCGPHPYFSVDYMLTFDGQLTEVERTRIYEDPSSDGLCVD